MKDLSFKLHVLTAILVMILTALNMSFAQNQKEIKGNSTIELNGYSLVSPSGDDWKYFITPDKNTVQFMCESSNILTGKENSTLLVVLKDSLYKETDKSERELADKFLEENLNGFKSQEEYMKIRNSRKCDTTIQGRKYFALFSSADDHDFVILSTYADNAFFIYFPDDFKTTRTFYQYVITSYYNLPTGNRNSNRSDLKPIFSTLKSLKYDETAVQKTNK